MHKIIISHPTGNANVRALANALARHELLLRFYTTIACFPHTVSDRLAQMSPFKELRKREYDAVLKACTKTSPWWEIGRMLSNKMGLKSLIIHEKGIFSIDNVYRRLDKYVSKKLNGADVVYAYEDGALETFRHAHRQNITCIYELPIGYWRSMQKILLSTKLARPEWANTLVGLMDSEEKLYTKDEELRLADTIIVASSFTQKTLSEYPGTLKQIKVIPYGFPEPYLQRQYLPLVDRPLKVLFVGGLSQRKGIAEVFDAVDSFPEKVALTVVGRKASDGVCEVLERKLSQCRYIPSLTHAEVLQEMRNNDVLLFPSYFEGFGLVITEAMSQGLPVITTYNTVGPDLIHEDGDGGWLVSAGDVSAINNIINRIFERPDILCSAGRKALEKAAARSWADYGREMVNCLS